MKYKSYAAPAQQPVAWIPVYPDGRKGAECPCYPYPGYYYPPPPPPPGGGYPPPPLPAGGGYHGNIAFIIFLVFILLVLGFRGYTVIEHIRKMLHSQERERTAAPRPAR